MRTSGHVRAYCSRYIDQIAPEHCARTMSITFTLPKRILNNKHAAARGFSATAKLLITSRIAAFKLHVHMNRIPIYVLWRNLWLFVSSVYLKGNLILESIVWVKTDRIFDFFITDVSLDEEVPVKFWSRSGLRIRTLDPDLIRLGGGLLSPSPLPPHPPPPPTPPTWAFNSSRIIGCRH